MLFRAPPVRLQPFFGCRSRTRLLLGARALRSTLSDFAGARGDEGGGRLGTVRTMWRQFASREVPGVAVTLELAAGGRTVLSATEVTDSDGFVRFDLPLDPAMDLPGDPVWEVARLHWRNRDGPQACDAHLLVPGTATRLAVISDIDDTIVETGITGGVRAVLGNLRRVLAQLPDERIAVPGVQPFYGDLGGGEVAGPATGAAGAKLADTRIAATHRPFFYVSSSPWNLFPYLVAFQRSKGLPLGPLLLRNWGLNRATLGRHGHGAHKAGAIARILALYPELDFALIGDDTQGDLPAYAAAARDYPGRIAAIFIRTTGGAGLSAQEEEARATITAAGVPLWLGDSWETGRDFIRSIGVTPGGETEQIVRAVDKVPTRAEGAGP